MYGFINYLVMVAVVCSCENLNACEMSSCLRKCCPYGMFLTRQVCEKTDMEFDFSAIGVSPEARIHDGVVRCKNSEDRLLLESSDNFYIEDNKLVWPVLDNLSVPYTHYCVDMIENLTAPRALVCYEVEEKTHYWAGKYVHNAFLSY